MPLSSRAAIVISGIIGTETASLMLLKAYAESGMKRYLVGGMLGYAGLAALLPLTLKESFGLTQVVWSTASILTGVTLGKFFYNEKLTGKDALGIPLAAIGSIILVSP
jgi:multidrug transporter EmrE-like cation transporter